MSTAATASEAHASVQGVCPACGNRTLFRGAGGHITCSWVGSPRAGIAGCPDPCAADTLLSAEHAHTDHIVTFTDYGFTVQHPLRERIAGTMESCSLHQELSRDLAGPPEQGAGSYRVVRRPVDGYSESYRSPGSLSGWSLEPVA